MMVVVTYSPSLCWPARLVKATYLRGNSDPAHGYAIPSQTVYSCASPNFSARMLFPFVLGRLAFYIYRMPVSFPVLKQEL